MEFTIGDVVAQSGVAARTIREWIRLDMVPRPRGYGGAALYSRKHMLCIWTIAALRRDGNTLEAIKNHMATLSLRDMARYQPKPAPQAAPVVTPAPAAAESSAAKEPAAQEGEATPHARLGGATTPEVAFDERLPGRRYALVPLLPGMVLMVDENAASVVRRAALEIVQRYGAHHGG